MPAAGATQALRIAAKRYLQARQKININKMGIIEGLIEGLFQEVIWGTIKRIGSIIRWIFLFRKYSYKDVYKQDWNGRIGLFTCLCIIIFIQFKVSSNNSNQKTEVIKINPQLKQSELKTGDIIFQTSLSSQSKAIQLATKSKYSHCGLIYKKGNDYFVFEAVQPVKLTPLNKWIARGKDGMYVIKRLKNADKILTPSALKKIKEIGKEFKGKSYDLTFEWSDDKIYCSELIWKIYQRAIGLEIGKLQKLKDFDLNDQAVQFKMKERYGNKIPMNETVISPVAIFDSELLMTIENNEYK